MSDVFSISKFKFIFLHVIDLGQFLKEIEDGSDKDESIRISHQTIADDRSLQNFHVNLVNMFGKSNNADKNLGDFCNPEPEGDVLKKAIKKATDAGGKQIFSHFFLKHQAPYVYTDEIPPGCLFNAMSEDNYPKDIAPGSRLHKNSNFSINYLGSKLRVFPNCVFGIELEAGFNYPSPSDKESIDIANCIEEIKFMEKMFKDAVYSKVKSVFLSLVKHNDNKLIYKETFPDKSDFERLSSFHKILILEKLFQNDEYITVNNLEGNIQATKVLFGLLNRANWQTTYREAYAKKLLNNFIAFQEDELFITDGSFSLFNFPDYWSQSKNKTQYIENLIVAIHYLLSWEAVGLYLESYVVQTRRVSLNIFQEKYSKKDIKNIFIDLTRLEDGVRLFRSAIMVHSIVNHGFSKKILRQVLNERETTLRLDELSSTIESVAKVLSLSINYVQDDKKENRRISWQKGAIFIALIALLANVYFSWKSFSQRNKTVPVFLFSNEFESKKIVGKYWEFVRDYIKMPLNIEKIKNSIGNYDLHDCQLFFVAKYQSLSIDALNKLILLYDNSPEVKKLKNECLMLIKKINPTLSIPD